MRHLAISVTIEGSFWELLGKGICLAAVVLVVIAIVGYLVLVFGMAGWDVVMPWWASSTGRRMHKRDREAHAINEKWRQDREAAEQEGAPDEEQGEAEGDPGPDEQRPGPRYCRRPSL